LAVGSEDLNVSIKGGKEVFFGGTNPDAVGVGAPHQKWGNYGETTRKHNPAKCPSNGGRSPSASWSHRGGGKRVGGV